MVRLARRASEVGGAKEGVSKEVELRDERHVPRRAHAHMNVPRPPRGAGDVVAGQHRVECKGASGEVGAAVVWMRSTLQPPAGAWPDAIVIPVITSWVRLPDVDDHVRASERRAAGGRAYATVQDDWQSVRVDASVARQTERVWHARGRTLGKLIRHGLRRQVKRTGHVGRRRRATGRAAASAGERHREVGVQPGAWLQTQHIELGWVHLGHGAALGGSKHRIGSDKIPQQPASRHAQD